MAQRERPKIIPAQNFHYAGRILLLPRDARPSSWKLPRMIARVADHELIYPPREMLGDADSPVDMNRIVTWAKKQNLNSLQGVIVSLDALTGGERQAPPEQIKARLELLHWIRQHQPNLPIYGFTQQPREEISQFGFDDLLLTQTDADAASLLVARLLSRTYQRPLKIRLVTSTELSAPLRQLLAAQLEAINGQPVAEGKADLVLFIHTPETDAAQLAIFTETLANTVAAGYYVALADVSGNAEAVVATLRTRKQLDLLQAYAASPEPSAALSRVLAHSTARLIAARVLRPKLQVDQLRRAERMQVELMLVRYLEDWGYAGSIRARVEQHVREQLKADPKQLGTATEAAEAFATSELSLLAEELFRTQFRYNLHSVLMGDGTRVDFQVELLQRCRARFPLQRTDALELDIGIHLPLIIGMSQLPVRK
ncbi:MAG TPA: DUF4127 family protein [Blastocatellia bacterium]|nr:DUF4127 family protein [Blastocatellia bacterium]